MNAKASEGVTALLLAWRQGDEAALDRLMPLIYRDLKSLARRQLRGESRHASLQATALVHEAYLRLVDYRRVQVQDRRHFLALAAQAMRRILIEAARRRRAARHGGQVIRVELDDESLELADQQAEEMLALESALTSLASLDERKARVVELRHFGGLTIDETADVLEVSTATVERDWESARAWLHREISQDRGR